MYRRMNPRWTGFPFAVLFLFGLMAPVIALAGNTHTEGGAVVEGLGAPETDATQISIYWAGDSSDQVTSTVGSTLAGHWLEDVGFLLTREWQVGDDHVAVLEQETAAGTNAHAGFYGVINKTLTSLDPDEFSDMTVRAIPVPAVLAGGGFVDLSWSPAIEDVGTPQMTNVAGYNLHRSDDGITFAQLNATTVVDTLYQDATVVFGNTYYYALSLVYRGAPEFPGTTMSANSDSVTPLDVTPPDAPTIVALPQYRSGLDQVLTWSDEAASGAADYYVEAATDDQFASIVDNSGWISTINHTFTGLSDAQTYWYRVRARDGASNESASSAAVTSTQDASPPNSNLAALAGYKTSSSIDLEWTAADATSGVNGIELFYAKDGGAYAQYAGGPYTSSPIAFDASTTGGDGNYDFYTLATDVVGNGEPAPEAPDASITIDTQAPNTPVLASMNAFIAGVDMDINWDDQSATGAAEYRVQASSTATFDAIEHDSDWLSGLNHTFAAVTEGQMLHIRVQSRDAAGNESAFSALQSSTADATAPATAVDALAAFSNQNNIDIAWTGTDAVSGLAGVELHYSFNGAPYQMLAGGPFTTSPIAFDAAAMGGDGLFEFYTMGADAVANAEAAPLSADAQISIDTQAPVLPTLAALPTFQPGSEMLVSWSDESASGASEYRVEMSTDPAFGSIDQDSGWISALSANFTGLTDATLYHYRVRARDAANNQTVFSALQSSTQDASPALSQVAALPNFSSDTMLSIEWSGSDATSGLNNVALFYARNGGAFVAYASGPFATSPIAFDASTTGGEGDYQFYTIASDNAGNMEAAPGSPDAQITIDSQPPASPVLAALSTWNASDNLTLNWSSTGDEYMAEAATDAAFSNIVDASDWIAADNFNFAGLIDGQSYWFRTRARDNAGNESLASSDEQTTIDTTAPVAALDALPSLSNTSSFDISWSGSDATSGLVDIDLYYSKDGGAFMLDANGPYNTSPISFDAATVGGDGDYSFYARARDAAGNREAAPATADAQTSIDTAAPGAPSIAGMQSFTPGSQLTVSWTDESASGAIEYMAEMSIAADFSSINASSSWMAALNHTFTSLNNAQTYYFRVKARDDAQNETGYSGNQNTTMDASAPSSNVEALPAMAAQMLVDIPWAGADVTSGVQSVELWYAVNGGAFALYPGGPFTSTPISFDASTAVGDGNYLFYTLATDMVGNVEATPAFPDQAMSIDTQAPAVPVLAALNSFTPGNTVALSWSDQSASGAAAYRAQASMDPGFASIAFESGWSNSLNYSFTNLTDSQAYYFRVSARDAAMNETSFSSFAQSTIDATAPQSQITAMPAFSTSAAFNLNWIGNDATSGIANVDLYMSKDGAPFTMVAGSPFASSPIPFNSALQGGDGHYAFYIVARDNATNLEAAPAGFDAAITVDTEAPDSPVLAALPSFQPGSSMTISWNDLSGMGATQYRAQASSNSNFTALVEDSGWIATTSHTFNGLTNGQMYFYRTKARDAANNETLYSTALSATQDATPPSSQLSALPTVISSLPLNLNWSGFDITSGVAAVDLYWSRNGSAFTPYTGGPFSSNPIFFDPSLTGGDGNYAFFTRGHDGAGNIEAPPAAPDAQTLIDTAAPNAPTIASMPAFSAGSSMAMSWSNQSGSGAIEYLAEMSQDAAFASIEASSNWIPGTSKVFNNLTDGALYYFRVRARDAANNESPMATITQTTMDDSAPASQVAALASVITTKVINLSWSGTDATSGVESVDLYFAKDGGAFAPFAGGPFTSTPISFDTNNTGGDGEYAFYTRARDAVGNRETSPASPDAQTVISSSPVEIAVLDALPEFTPGVNRGLNWLPGAGSTEYLVQAATNAQFTSIYAASVWTASTSWSFQGLADGQTYWYRVRARNDAGVESAYSTFEVSTQDATAPISQVAPLSKATTASQSLDLSWSASDATSGIAGVELMVSYNGGSFVALAGGPYTTSPISFNSTSANGDGDYAFYTIATDRAGNAELAPSTPDAEVTIDSQAPAQPMLLTEPEYTAGRSNTIAWSPVSGAQDYFVQCASDGLFQNIAAVSGWIAATSHQFTNLNPGQTYFYRVRARDNASNISAYSAVVFSMQSPGRDLAAGWNLISFDVAPEIASIEKTLSEIDGKFSIVRSYTNGSFHTYLPSLPVEMNDLQAMDPRRGYWIYMTEAATLSVAGSPIADNTIISMNAGWELVSYLPNTPQAPNMALYSIDANLTLARTYNPTDGYSSYYPGFAALSDLNMMQPGYGYWMYMGAADDLIYNTSLSPSSLEEAPISKRDQPSTLTKSQTGSAVPTVMDLYSMNVTIDGEAAVAGTVVEILDANGTLLASRELTKDGVLGLTHLLGDVSVTEDDEGAVNGEALTFRIQGSDVELVGSQPITWTANEVAKLDLRFEEVQSLLPRVYSLAQNYPNPFNPATEISYAIPSLVDGVAVSSTPVTLQIFDIRGRVVRSLVSARQAPGSYSARWDGKNDRGVSVNSGVYFYRLQTDHFKQTRKMMMVK